MEKILSFGGITFLIVRFTSLNETYLLLGKDILDFISTNKRKSIPISYFKDKGYFIEFKYTPRLDYIKIIDKILR